MVGRFAKQILLVAAFSFLAAATFAQATLVLVIDTERAYQTSIFGASLRAEVEQIRESLRQENERLLAELQAEENDLTLKKSEMTPQEFQSAARAFDEKVGQTRRDQDEKERQVEQANAAARRQFGISIEPFVAQIMQERGALVVLEAASVRFRAPETDITQDAINRIDAAFESSQNKGEDQ